MRAQFVTAEDVQKILGVSRSKQPERGLLWCVCHFVKLEVLSHKREE